MPTVEDKVITFVAMEKAELLSEKREEPALGSNEVSGRTLMSLISQGTELAMYQELWGTFPSHPGYAAIFEVEEVGSGVSDVAAGDRVFCMGHHRLCQRFDRQEVVPVPKSLSTEKALFARMMGVTMSTLVTTTARPTAKILITGLGVVGNLAAQLFDACGYDVVAVEPNAERREIAQSCGIKDVRERVPLDDPLLAEKVSLVLDCSGHEQAVLDACKIVKKRGEVVLTGVPWKRFTDLPAYDVLREVFFKYAVLRSGWEWELPMQPTEFREGSVFQNLASAMEWIDKRRVDLANLYAIRLPSDAQAVYQDLLNRRAERLSVVLDWAECRK